MQKQLSKRTLSKRQRTLERSTFAQRLAVAGTFLTATLTRASAAFAGASPSPSAAPVSRLGSLETVRELIIFLMTLLQGVGIVFIAFGVIALAMSFQSHDESQKSKALLAIIGGCLAVSVRFVIVYIAPQATEWVA